MGVLLHPGQHLLGRPAGRPHGQPDGAAGNHELQVAIVQAAGEVVLDLDRPLGRDLPPDQPHGHASTSRIGASVGCGSSACSAIVACAQPVKRGVATTGRTVVDVDVDVVAGLVVVVVVGGGAGAS